jgi:hypothetical protein
MKRREFITLQRRGGSMAAGGAGAAAGDAGDLHSATPEAFAGRLRGFHQGLKEAGVTESDYRWPKIARTGCLCLQPRSLRFAGPRLQSSNDETPPENGASREDHHDNTTPIRHDAGRRRSAGHKRATGAAAARE